MKKNPSFNPRTMDYPCLIEISTIPELSVSEARRTNPAYYRKGEVNLTKNQLHHLVSFLLHHRFSRHRIEISVGYLPLDLSNYFDEMVEVNFGNFNWSKLQSDLVWYFPKFLKYFTEIDDIELYQVSKKYEVTPRSESR